MPENNNLNSIAGTKIQAAPVPEKNIGADTQNTLPLNIIQQALNSIIDLSSIESFSTVAQTREQIYQLIDTMAQDSTIASILETYCEDVVETNDNGLVVWCESSDDKVAKYVSYLLETMNVDKHIYNWIYSLIKYGDLYLRLFRESDYKDDDIFNNDAADKKQNLQESIATINNDIDDEHISLTEAAKIENDKEDLKENVIVNINKESDHYVHYLEAVQNPGEMFELTRYGKTMGYIKAPVNIQTSNIEQKLKSNLLRYQMKHKDVEVFGALDFVHASLADNSSRTPEEVTLFKDENNENGLTYTVKRGQSLLYNTFKIWRELSLLENSVLLNRLTKSSILRIISVEVGDMPKENIGSHLQSIKALIEQKAAINAGNSMSEYTNPGPVENNIYVPTHGGIGAISSQQIGGDVDPKQLTDLSYFQDKFFASLRVPKQFFGVTDDAAGFNGGSSLSIISSRYGKAVKRIQNTILQALTDAINLMLLDKKLSRYIGKFTLRMTAPITQEEIDKRDNLSNKVRVINDILSTLTDIADPAIKLKVTKALLATIVADTEVIGLIQDQIDLLEAEKEDDDNEDKKPTEEKETTKEANRASFEQQIFGDSEEQVTDDDTIEDDSENIDTSDDDSYLPTPDELNLDLTQNS